MEHPQAIQQMTWYDATLYPLLPYPRACKTSLLRIKIGHVKWKKKKKKKRLGMWLWSNQKLSVVINVIIVTNTYDVLSKHFTGIELFPFQGN
jgi:hypothetical protein